MPSYQPSRAGARANGIHTSKVMQQRRKAREAQAKTPANPGSSARNAISFVTSDEILEYRRAAAASVGKERREPANKLPPKASVYTSSLSKLWQENAEDQQRQELAQEEKKKKRQQQQRTKQQEVRAQRKVRLVAPGESNYQGDGSFHGFGDNDEEEDDDDLSTFGDNNSPVAAGAATRRPPRAMAAGRAAGVSNEHRESKLIAREQRSANSRRPGSNGSSNGSDNHSESSQRQAGYSRLQAPFATGNGGDEAEEDEDRIEPIRMLTASKPARKSIGTLGKKAKGKGGSGGARGNDNNAGDDDDDDDDDDGASKVHPPQWHDGVYERRAAEQRKRDLARQRKAEGMVVVAGAKPRSQVVRDRTQDPATFGSGGGRRRLHGPPSEAAKALQHVEKKKQQQLLLLREAKAADPNAPPAGTKSVLTRRPEHRFAVRQGGDFNEDVEEEEDFEGEEEESEEEEDENGNAGSGNVGRAIARADEARTKEMRRRERASLRAHKRNATAADEAQRGPEVREQQQRARDQARAQAQARRVRDATDLVSAFRKEKEAKEEFRRQQLAEATVSVERKQQMRRHSGGKAANKARVAWAHSRNDDDDGAFDDDFSDASSSSSAAAAAKGRGGGSVLAIGQRRQEGGKGGGGDRVGNSRRDGYDAFDRLGPSEEQRNPPVRSKWVDRWAKMALKRKDDDGGDDDDGDEDGLDSLGEPRTFNDDLHLEDEEGDFEY